VWLSVDPLATKYPHITPYNFVENNPIRLVDPTGLGPECEDCPEGSIEPVTVTAEKLPPKVPYELPPAEVGPEAPSEGADSYQSDDGRNPKTELNYDNGVALMMYGNGSGGTTPWTSGKNRRVIGSVDANDPAISAAFGLAGKSKSRKGINIISVYAEIFKILYGRSSGNSDDNETDHGASEPTTKPDYFSSQSTKQTRSNDTSIGIGRSGINGFWTGRIVKIDKNKIDSLKSTLKSNEKLYAN